MLTRLAPYSTSAYVLNSEAMSRGALSDPLLSGSKRPLMKKEANLNCKGLRKKRYPMKKEAPLKRKEQRKKDL
jgi:hypothetical protein